MGEYYFYEVATLVKTILLQLVMLQHVFLFKVKLLQWCFSCLINCANGTKSRKASHIWEAVVSKS